MATQPALTFGEWVTKTRMKQDLAIEDLAPAAGVSKSSIYMIEAGNTTPRLDTAERISTSLGIPLWKALKAVEDSSGKRKS